MVQMLTLFGRDLKELKYNDLKRELRAQKFILLSIKHLFTIQSRKWGAVKTQLQEDKETIFGIYTEHLEAFITEIEYVMAHRSEPLENHKNNHRRPKAQIRRENAEKRKATLREGDDIWQFKKQLKQDGMLVSWDKERFILIAQDRGYQTEELIVQEIGKELNLSLARAKLIMDKGRFTWGQVLCLGAMLQMTPKEFCDTFLAGYFVDHFGEYRADYENLCKEELLKRAVKPQLPPMEEVVVGADGKPLDEEIWF